MKRKNESGYGESADDLLFYLDLDRLNFDIGKGEFAKPADKKINKSRLPKEKIIATETPRKEQPVIVTARLVRDGLCPCGCGREVRSGAFYYSRYCGEKYRRAMKRIGANTRPTYTGRTKIYKPSHAPAAQQAGD
jgi:hypothetical protein